MVKVGHYWLKKNQTKMACIGYDPSAEFDEHLELVEIRKAFWRWYLSMK